MDDNVIDLSKFTKGKNESKLNEAVLEEQFIGKYAEYHEYNDKGQVIYTYDTNGKSIKYVSRFILGDKLFATADFKPDNALSTAPPKLHLEVPSPSLKNILGPFINFPYPVQ